MLAAASRALRRGRGALLAWEEAEEAAGETWGRLYIGPVKMPFRLLAEDEELFLWPISWLLIWTLPLLSWRSGSSQPWPLAFSRYTIGGASGGWCMLGTRSFFSGAVKALPGLDVPTVGSISLR